jgi:hypothetical protein
MDPKQIDELVRRHQDVLLELQARHSERRLVAEQEAYSVLSEPAPPGAGADYDRMKGELHEEEAKKLSRVITGQKVEAVEVAHAQRHELSSLAKEDLVETTRRANELMAELVTSLLQAAGIDPSLEPARAQEEARSLRADAQKHRARVASLEPPAASHAAAVEMPAPGERLRVGQNSDLYPLRAGDTALVTGMDKTGGTLRVELQSGHHLTIAQEDLAELALSRVISREQHREGPDLTM